MSRSGNYQKGKTQITNIYDGTGSSYAQELSCSSFFNPHIEVWHNCDVRLLCYVKQMRVILRRKVHGSKELKKLRAICVGAILAWVA